MAHGLLGFQKLNHFQFDSVLNRLRMSELQDQKYVQRNGQPHSAEQSTIG